MMIFTSALSFGRGGIQPLQADQRLHTLPPPFLYICFGISISITHGPAKVSRLSAWRREIPVEPVFSNTLVQPGSASTETDFVGVMLPTIMNTTTGTMGIVLSEH